MKTLAASIVGLAAASASLRADALPKTESFARYEAMLTRSPFTAPTAVAHEHTTGSELYIEGIAEIRDEIVSTLASRSNKNVRAEIRTKKPNKK